MNNVQDKLNAKLHRYAKEGNVNELKILLHYGADYTSIDEFYRTALHIAASYGHTDVIDVLHEVGKLDNINAKDDDGYTALHLAACNGHVWSVSKLLSLDADHTIGGLFGQTPLMRAALHGREAVIDTFSAFNKLDNINAKDTSGNTALHLAVWGGNTGTVAKLLEYGANPNSRNYSRETPLIQAVGYDEGEIVEKLLEYRADIYIEDKKGATALSKAKGEIKEILEKFEARFTQNKAVQTEFDERLWRAAKVGNVEEVKELLSRGADHRITNAFGWTPLMVASQFGHTNIIAAFHEAGKLDNINATQEWGWSALHFAAKDGHMEGVSRLLKYGADMHVRDKRGNTPLSIANGKTREILEKHESRFKFDFKQRNLGQEDTNAMLREAAMDGDVKKLKIQFEHRADHTSTDRFGRTALHCAAFFGHVNIIDALHEAGKLDNINARDDEGYIALHKAAGRGHVEVVKKLLDYGADPMRRTDHGETVLMIAVERKRHEIIDLLIEKGIDLQINAQNTDGETALHVALRTSDCGRMVNKLLSLGADIHIEANSGHSPWIISRMLEDRVLRELFEGYV